MVKDTVSRIGGPFTALVSGLVQFIFFPGTALLGASGIVFMMILLSSFGGVRNGAIPTTLILVAIFYLKILPAAGTAGSIIPDFRGKGKGNLPVLGAQPPLGSKVFLFFPSTALLGASGIVFMMILLSSFGGVRNGTGRRKISGRWPSRR